MSMLPGLAVATAPTEQMRELGADEDDVRKMSIAGTHPGVRQRLWGLEARLDPTVTFEEFTYWAKVEREMEQEESARYKSLTSGQGFMGVIKNYFTSNAYEDAKVRDATHASEDRDQGIQWSEKKSPDTEEGALSPIAPAGTHDFDADDGYGLGAGIFLLMGLAAGASGWMIWYVFLGLDSSRYPVLSFGDPFFRLYGPKIRHFINFTQALQMFLTVAVVLLGQTGIIAQLAGSVNLCFIVCGIISLVVSIASGYMRSLKHLGWFCNSAVWINIVSFIIVCAAAAKYGPDPTAAVQTGILNKDWVTNPAPVKTFANAPPPEYQQSNADPFAAKFNGINSMVYAYSGAIMFVAFLSEMRHPMDFWKAMLVAQAFITGVYIFFGAFVYSFYGQYAYVSITQSVKPLNLQVVGNVLSLITGWLAVFLYFNVGMKTVYLEVGQELFNLPAITTRKGKYLWWALGPVYWIIAFVISMSIPQFSAFTNFVGGLFSLNFTYSLSGVMCLGYKIQQAAKLPGEGFDPATGETTRLDGGYKRWVRGFRKSWKLSIPILIFTGCGFAASGMGTWAAILALEEAFSQSVLTSWTCTNPYYTG
ncbi:hypothetical protein N7448_005417 [Penicillium atrosanguineum]|uniref:Amino acid transporter transmembrane domain-containing protein n=1 Tax=Penicillium atrosanguineum TaxID=1132637 RepID=A0A9W9L509_9EURO|nr:hypothetical protein N7448_005417 [Penicillium atrosanguineum]KAJ5302770.1 hypothetical protein N7476_009569 [Penicillium atrosanguineum]